MFAVYLCLVFNAHPHFWLPDAELEVENKNLARINRRISDYQNGIAGLYVRLGELQAKPKVDPRNVEALQTAIDSRVEYISRSLGELDKTRVQERARALAHPKQYLIRQ